VLPNFSEDLNVRGRHLRRPRQLHRGSIQTYYIDGAKGPSTGCSTFRKTSPRKIIVETLRTLMPQFRIPGAKVAFVATGRQQLVTGENAKKLTASAPPWHHDVLGSVDFIPLNRGEAWGYLRMFPKDLDSLAAIDIPVFDELPSISPSSPARSATTGTRPSREPEVEGARHPEHGASQRGARERAAGGADQ
jgi:hypothetical protein